MADGADSGGTKVSLATHEQRLITLEGHDKEHKRNTADLRTFQTQSELRFTNGQKTMSALDLRIAAIEPKYIAPWKYITGGASLVATIVVLVIAINTMFLERPTRAETTETSEKHEQNGHGELRDDVDDIKEGLERVNSAQNSAGEKLDIVLERLPEPTKRRRDR